MESTSQLIRCQPFSDYPTESQQTCCSKMNLLPAVNNPLHCKTCHIRKIVPKGVAPIFPANYCADEHISNNHTIVFLLCTQATFQTVWSKQIVNSHVTECIQKTTIGVSRPYVCISCYKTLWFK